MQNLDLKNKTVFITGVAGFIGSNLAERLLKEIEGIKIVGLKGVTVAEGCVIGAGTVLTKSTHPYGIYVGVPGRRVSERFENEELEDHINILQEKSKW